MNQKQKSVLLEIRALVKRGEIFTAYNRASEALVHCPDDLELIQLYGLSLARLGATDRALRCFEDLYRKGHTDVETMGILGRVYKDVWRKTGNAGFAKMSRDIYLKNFIRTKDYYTGINTATMSLIINELPFARTLADEVIGNLQDRAADYWSTVTCGEAYLIMGKADEAIFWYRKALPLAGKNFGDINSSYQQIRLIERYTPVPGEILDLFKPPTIVAFTGHVIDRPERTEPRFPDYIEQFVRDDIVRTLDELNAEIGYSSAACGADIIFIEAMLERGAEVNVYLPFCVDDFMKTSVAHANKDWVTRFKRIMEKTSVRYITEEFFFGNEFLFPFTNNVITGMSVLRAHLMMSAPTLLAVLHSGEKTDGTKTGGTFNFMKEWPCRDRMRVIDTAPYIDSRAARVTAVDTAGKKGEAASLPVSLNRSLRYILFADIVGFSKFNEECTPYFMFELLQMFSDRLQLLKNKPEIINSWGDALFVIYKNPNEIMEFAFLLKNLILTTDWTARNLPGEINIRIAIHAGPVFIGTDPITKKPNAYGTHINRTARMEPVTLPGCVYASEQFAAALILETGDRYLFEYVGILNLPKNFGKQEIYHITERDGGR